jgi:alpha-mannosidase
MSRKSHCDQPGFQQPPFKIEGEVAVTAWKPAEDGDGWILRLQETADKGTYVGLVFDEPMEVTRCDLLERKQGEGEKTMRWGGSLDRHGILALRLQKG